MSAEEEKVPWPVKYRALFLAATLILALLSYGNSFQGSFVWDDIPLIKENPDLRDPTALPRLFATYFKLSPDEPTSFYRPLVMATYWLDYRLWGLNPLGYHLTNLILHLLATWCVYLAGRRLFSETVALVATLLFALHPVHTESVTFISGRTDILCAVFYLAAVTAHISKRTLLAAFFFAAALLTKEMAITLPLVLVAIDLWGAEGRPSWRRLAGRLVPCLLIIAGYIVLRTQVLGASAVPIPTLDSMLVRIQMAPVVVLKYLVVCIFPWKLNAMYAMNAAGGWADPLLMAGWLVAAGLLVLIWIGRRAGWGFCLFWFLVTLLPVLNLLQTGSAPMAERFLYIPSAGFVWLAGLAAERFVEDGRVAARNGVIAVLALLAVFYVGRTIVRNMDWRDEFVLFSRLVKDSPASAVAHYNLGCLYRDRNDYESAKKHWLEAVRLDPGHAGAHNNLGAVYDVTGHYDQAMVQYRKALELNPKNAVTWFNLGRIYRMKGQHAEATRCFEEYRRLTR